MKSTCNIGDWVYVDNYCALYNKTVLKIRKINRGPFYYFEKPVGVSGYNESDNFGHKHIMRFATPEEIREAGGVMVINYEVYE